MRHRDEDHDLTRLRQFFVVLAESSVAIEPAERPLHDPALRIDLEAGPANRAPHDLQHPAIRQEPRRQRLAAVARVHKQRHEPDELPAQLSCYEPGTSPVRDIGSRDDDREEQPERIDGYMPFAALDRLASVIAADPPFSAVLTL